MTHSHLQSGFSLVETLVAITIVLIVIVGPMTIISTATNSTSFSSEQVVAFFLAQEGAELAQKARDDIILDRFTSGPQDWSDFINESTGPYEECFSASGCGLEISEASDGEVEVADCSASGNCRLHFDDGSGSIRSRYTYDSTGNTETPYTRVVRFESTSPYEVRVVSQVEWFSGISRNAQTVEVETYLVDVYAP